jgi:hypothetical protein
MRRTFRERRPSIAKGARTTIISATNGSSLGDGMPVPDRRLLLIAFAGFVSAGMLPFLSKHVANGDH